MMGELFNMDVVDVPTYDGYQAAATALTMAACFTGRS
jgi:glycine dehydrogenase subunit 1